MSAARVELIRQCIENTLAPVSLEVIDDSHLHAGHASAGGAGHFTVRITSDAFAGKSLIQRHRLVYDAVATLMPSEIHALSIKAKTTTE